MSGVCEAKFVSILKAMTACVLMAGSALGAATYTDSTGDGDILPTFPHLDISSVDVSNTATRRPER